MDCAILFSLIFLSLTQFVLLLLTLYTIYILEQESTLLKIWISFNVMFLVVKILQKFTKKHVRFRYQLVPIVFKADQWRTLITVYSLVLLNSDHLQCWLILVIMRQRITMINDLTTADLLLLNHSNILRICLAQSTIK